MSESKIDLLKSNPGVGGSLEILRNDGQAISGQIRSFSDGHLVLVDSTGRETVVFESIIGGWTII